MTIIKRPGIILSIMIFLLGCATEDVAKNYLPASTHSEYSNALGSLKLDSKNLGKAWLEAADRAQTDAVPIAIPFQEERFFEATQPKALGVVFTVPRGVKLKINVEAGFSAYFLDVFRIQTDNGKTTYIPAASKPAAENNIEFTPRVEGRYLLRLQPELLEEGSMKLTITGHASMAWPVKESTEKDIISYFGMDRDAGERVHHGLDIKAPRGQAALAAIKSSSSPGSNPRGGNVVRMSGNTLDVMLYYAHLDTRLIERNTLVESGTIIGTVGTSGNAAGGIPHLHIGIYDGSWRKPVDPWYFFIEPSNNLKPLANLTLFGWAQINKPVELLSFPPAQSGLRVSPARYDYEGNPLDPAVTAAFNVSRAGEAKTTLAAGTPVKITGRRSNYIYVQTPEGVSGYLDFNNIKKTAPIERTLKQNIQLSRFPASPPVLYLEAGTKIAELGRFNNYTLIQYNNQTLWTTAP